MLLKEMSYKACRVGHLLCFDAPQHDNVSFGCLLLDFRHPDVSTGLGQSPIQNTISREIVTLRGAKSLSLVWNDPLLRFKDDRFHDVDAPLTCQALDCTMVLREVIM